MTPVVFGRRVIEVAREGSYGTDPGTPSLFPSFNADELPVWAVSRFESSRSSRAFGGGRARMVDPFGEFAPIRTFLMDGDGAWLMLLEASGFLRRSATEWAAVQSPAHTSLTVRHHIGNRRQILTGARTSLSLRAAAGQPIVVEANLTGRMTDVAGTMPTQGSQQRALTQFCAADLTFDVEGSGIYRPKGLQEVSISTGTVLASKVMSGGRMLWRVQNVVPEIRVVVEDDQTAFWADGPTNRKVGIGITVGGWRWEWPAATVGPPEGLRLLSGLAGVALVSRSIADRARPVVVKAV